jgi:Acyl-CoA reductase (LuxC)
MSLELDALERIERLLVAVRRAAAPGSEQRAALVRRLVQTTGLAAAGVEWALEHCLEQNPGQAELRRLIAGVSPAPSVHVILPASVFVAAHRSLALALAASPRVSVKPSRREPALIEALHAQDPALFELVPRIRPEPGDHVFAYGSDTTLDALRSELPRGTMLHAHGSGFGVTVVELEPASERSARHDDRVMARAIAEDTACFDQRGCLSPRFVLALAEPARAQRFAEHLAAELADLEQQLPLGQLDADERAETTWYRECAACFGRVIPAGSGAVILRDVADSAWPEGDGLAALDVPPAGRQLEVIAVRRLEPALQTLLPWLTTVGCSSPALEARLRAQLAPLRIAPLGRMQQPPFDGPVDRRTDPRGTLIE